MATKSAEILKPLKLICKRIETEKDISKHLIDVKAFAGKGAYYQHHTFVELLAVLSNNPNLPTSTKSQLITTLGSFLNDETGNNKDSITCLLYNFIVKHKSRTDLFDEIILISSFTNKKTFEKCDVPLNISEVLMKFALTKAQRQILYRNYTSCLGNYNSKPELCLKFLQSILRAVISLINGKRGTHASEMIEETLLKTILSKSLLITNDETYSALLDLITVFGKTGQQSKTMSICYSLTEGLKHILTDKDHVQCNGILQKVFKMIRDSSINAAALLKLNDEHQFRNYKTMDASVFVQKTTNCIVKLFKVNHNFFDLTFECFSAYHFLVANIFHIFKKIVSKTGTYSCCIDIKRHESHNLMNSVFNLAIKILKTTQFNQTFGKNLVYHMGYDFQVCSELKCKEQNKEKLTSFNSVYNILYEFTLMKTMIAPNIEIIHDMIKTMFKLWNSIPKENRQSVAEPLILAINIYEQAIKSKTSLTGLASVLAYQLHETTFLRADKDTQKLMMKTAINLQGGCLLQGYSSAAEFINSCNFKDSLFSPNKISYAEILLIELSASFRYNPLVEPESIAKMFMSLCQATKDPEIIAKGSQSINDAAVKSMDWEEFKKIIRTLERSVSDKFNMEVSLALALNNYSIYFVMSEATVEELKRDVLHVIQNLDLKKELDHLKYLNESLRHFTDVIYHLIQNNEDLDKIISTKRMINILNNMAIQYFMRGIKYKDFEAYALLWHLVKIEKSSFSVLLNVGSFFIDHHEVLIDVSGNYIKTSKKLKQLTIEEIIRETTEMLETQFLDSFEEQTDAVQANILSYLVSIWVYNLTNGRKSDGLKIYKQFKKLWDSTTLEDGSSSKETIRAKLYFSLVELNLKCLNKSADNFMSIACSTLLAVKSLDRDFMFQFYQIYYRYTLQAINYTINRQTDLSHYDAVTVNLVASAARKGYCLKVLDLLSLSILRYLNMEKIDHAKNTLKDITKLLGLKETILIETPTKFEAPTTIFDYAGVEERVRKAPVAPDSPIQCELSMIYEDHSSELMRQLQTFVHAASCHCEICSTPQLKFLMFQIGCHYSRLMWMLEKFDVSLSFHKFAMDPWRSICDKLRRIKDSEFLMINKLNFSVFSIRWLFQYADCLIRMECFDEIEEVYQEVDLLCTENVPDISCFKQILYCRKENLSFILEHGLLTNNEIRQELSFVDFLKVKPIKGATKKNTLEFVFTPVAGAEKKKLMMGTTPAAKSLDIIFVDDSDEEHIFTSTKIAKTSSTVAKKSEKLPTKIASAKIPVQNKKTSTETKIGKATTSNSKEITKSSTIRIQSSKPKDFSDSSVMLVNSSLDDVSQSSSTSSSSGMSLRGISSHSSKDSSKSSALKTRSVLKPSKVESTPKSSSRSKPKTVEIDSTIDSSSASTSKRTTSRRRMI